MATAQNNEQAYTAKISLSLKYKKTATAAIEDIEIQPERITYVIIDHQYLNTHILPIVYVSVKLDNDTYSKVVNTQENSKFRLILKKRNTKNKNSIYTKVIDDTFSYVTSTTNANYSSELDKNAPDGGSYLGITVGLVSVKATNILRTTFSGIYKNTSASKLIEMATMNMPNLVKEPIQYDTNYDSLLVTPVSSIYKFLQFIFDRDAFYDSQFMLYMDFNKSYLLSNHAVGVSANDGKPTTVMVYIKDYTASDAYLEGFEYNKKKNTYTVNINANNTQVVVNDATEKVATNIVGYSVDKDEAQSLNLDMNETSDNTGKRIYLKTYNAAAVKNEINSNSVYINLFKQNLDSDIFTPNKVFKVTNYPEYEKYNGNYKLMYKKEAYYQQGSAGEFILTTSVGLRLVGDEEVAYSEKDTTVKRSKTTGSRYSNTKKSSTKKNSTTKASRK